MTTGVPAVPALSDSGATSGTDSGVTSDELIRRAAALRPALVAAQAETERLTYYPERIHQAFLDAGFYRTLVPRRYGGFAFPFSTYVRILVELSRGCMSAAWCMGLAGAHALQVGSYFGERAQDEIFGDGDFRAASVAAPEVTAARDGNGNGAGWILNGTVGYCSGAPYSTHFVGQALDASLPPEQAAERMLLFVAPRSEWTMLDDWGDSLGLRGSGSQSIRFDGGRVPGHHVLENFNLVAVDVTGGTPGLALHGDPLYAGPTLVPFTLTLAALMVGGGLNMLDAYEQQLRTGRTSLPPIVPRLTDPDFQRWYGAALARLGMAEAALRRCADEHVELCERAASGGEPYGPEDEMRVSVIAREIIIDVWETVDQYLLRSIGARVMREGAWFERIYRDITMAVVHRNTGFRDAFHRIYGQMRLGVAVPPGA